MEDKKIPKVESKLRHQILNMPSVIRECSGIVIFGRRIKSLVFTTDIAIIRNCDADAVFAVYPFTPQQVISDAIIKASYIPVFCGVGGGTTKGIRTKSLAKDVESQGAFGVVVNSPIPVEDIKTIVSEIDIPLVATITSESVNVKERLDAGASILNVAAGVNTAKLVKQIRERYPDVPIIASGGNKEEFIKETIDAGANAITFTPPSTAELFKEMMNKYRS